MGFMVSPGACPAAARLKASGEVAAAAAASALRLRKPRRETSGGGVKGVGVVTSPQVFRRRLLRAEIGHLSAPGGSSMLT
jgi:hypothetical protein